MEWVYDDGGRANYFKAEGVGDCATRAIAIASQCDYRQVYDELAAMQATKGLKKTARNGVRMDNLRKYLADHGWHWHATMKFGTGCQVHMRDGELPSGRIICRLSGHVAAVVDGVLYDTYDCTRDGTRCVYGYWSK